MFDRVPFYPADEDRAGAVGAEPEALGEGGDGCADAGVEDDPEFAADVGDAADDGADGVGDGWRGGDEDPDGVGDAGVGEGGRADLDVLGGPFGGSEDDEAALGADELDAGGPFREAFDLGFDLVTGLVDVWGERVAGGAKVSAGGGMAEALTATLGTTDATLQPQPLLVHMLIGPCQAPERWKASKMSPRAPRQNTYCWSVAGFTARAAALLGVHPQRCRRHMSNPPCQAPERWKASKMWPFPPR